MSAAEHVAEQMSAAEHVAERMSAAEHVAEQMSAAEHVAERMSEAEHVANGCPQVWPGGRSVPPRSGTCGVASAGGHGCSCRLTSLRSTPLLPHTCPHTHTQPPFARTAGRVAPARRPQRARCGVSFVSRWEGRLLHPELQPPRGRHLCAVLQVPPPRQGGLQVRCAWYRCGMCGLWYIKKVGLEVGKTMQGEGKVWRYDLCAALERKYTGTRKGICAAAKLVLGRRHRIK
eukprot:359171-Chlamydomonas_euryale.AAC.3